MLLAGTLSSAVFSGGAARAPPEFGGSGKGRSLISAFWSLAITTSTPGFEKLNTALLSNKEQFEFALIEQFLFPSIFK
jgi:hypothetical protein